MLMSCPVYSKSSEMTDTTLRQLMTLPLFSSVRHTKGEKSLRILVWNTPEMQSSMVASGLPVPIVEQNPPE